MKFNKGIFVVFISGLIGMSCFYYLPFFIQQNQIRQQVKASIEKEAAQQFTFSEKEFSALAFDGDDEFYLNNKLYDIVSAKKSGGKIIVLAVADEKEKELISDFNKLSNSFGGAEKNGNSPVKTFGKIISLKYLTTNAFSTNAVITLNLSQSFTEPASVSLQRGYFSSPVNPPDLA